MDATEAALSGAPTGLSPSVGTQSVLAEHTLHARASARSTRYMRSRRASSALKSCSVLTGDAPSCSDKQDARPVFDHRELHDRTPTFSERAQATAFLRRFSARDLAKGG